MAQFGIAGCGIRYALRQHEAVLYTPEVTVGMVVDKLKPGSLRGETTQRPTHVIVVTAKTTEEERNGI